MKHVSMVFVALFAALMLVAGCESDSSSGRDVANSGGNDTQSGGGDSQGGGGDTVLTPTIAEGCEALFNCCVTIFTDGGSPDPAADCTDFVTGSGTAPSGSEKTENDPVKCDEHYQMYVDQGFCS